MLISTKGRYALRILLDLYSLEKTQCEEIPLKTLSETEGLSEKYLESIIGSLSKAKIVKGTRGKGGGYKLIRSANEISIKEILLATEKTLAPVACMAKSELCPKNDICKTLPLWCNIEHLLSSYLSTITLQDLAEGKIEKLYD